MADILSRLPSKSIARFRCVCKQLPSLTYDPRFLKSQHERSSSYAIIGKSGRHGDIKLYDRNLSVETSYKVKLGRVDYKLSNFVDGLTCAYDQNPKSDIYLLNPTTREIQKIPKKDDRRERSIDQVVSLCFDMTTGHYKVVRFISNPQGLHIYCEIYDVGGTQWRRVCECPFGFCDILSYPVFVHGAHHWVEDVRGRRRFYEKELKGIFKFNVKDEKFESPIPLPYPSCSHMSVPCLMESAGNLWVAFHNRRDENFEIWTRKDYLNDTLVMEYKFNINSPLSIHDRCHFEGIVNGEVLLKFYGSDLGKWHVACYPDNGILPRLFTLEKRDESFAIYKESLISPKKLLKASRRCQKKGQGA